MVYKNVWRTFGRDTSHFYLMGTLIREDSLNRVFRKDEHFQEEQLLYDFNKEIGDTISYFSDGGSFSCDYIVVEIDTLELLNGQEKRKFLLQSIDNRFENSFIVDGVGSSFGFLNPFEGGCTFDYNAVLMCMYEDGVQIFQNPDEGICYYYRVSTKEISKSDNIKISPIPFENELSIDLSNSPQEYQSIEIFNGEGKVYWKREVSMNSFSIETESFPPGIYLLRLRTYKGEFKTQRILKI
ncbi:MAG: T9SS type A sorting domain-containing protein [Saprospiraceae bacterium]|nr:T9SS type A sorting domain-containing protein [Saprospiraceae bacterium]